jgi:exopolysaccharide biosynthesis polyprenyl glycosylphosphotransferase
MIVLLALFEATALWSAIGALIFVWVSPAIVDWLDIAMILGQALAISVCCIVAFYYNDLYDLRVVHNVSAFAERLLQAFGIAFILLAVFYAFFPEARIPREALIGSVLIVAGLLLPLRAVSYMAMRRKPFTERILMVGAGPLALKVMEQISTRPHLGFVVVGVLADGPALTDLPCASPIRRLHCIADAIVEWRPDRVLVSMAERRGQLPVRELLQARGRGLPVEDAAAMYERLTGKLAIESLTPSYLIFSDGFKKSRLILTVSRLFGVALSAMVLVILAPVLALTALSIKIDSRGPVFIVQERVGAAGRRFRLVKFRTMHPIASESSIWFDDNCQRITRVGRWLRAFRLDEVPQLLNVLRGDMNLVGPRPHRAEKFAALEASIPYFSLRSLVRPGLTGWAQVRHGYASNLLEEIEKVRYDLYYIKHQCLWLDVRILFDTVKIILLGRGSAVSRGATTAILRAKKNEASISEVTTAHPATAGRAANPIERR